MGQPHAYKSGTSSEVVKASGGIAHEISLAPAAAISTLIAYDHPSAASGSVICRLQGGANSSGQCYAPNGGVAFSKGLYIAITGAGAAYNAAYD